MTTRKKDDQEHCGYLLTGTVITDGAVLENQAVIIRESRIDHVGPLADTGASRLAGLTNVELPEGSVILPVSWTFIVMELRGEIFRPAVRRLPRGSDVSASQRYDDPAGQSCNGVT